MRTKQVPPKHETSSNFNGWKNWETWEAYNLITSYEDIYLRMFDDLETNDEHVIRALNSALKRLELDTTYLDKGLVDFKAIAENLNE